MKTTRLVALTTLLSVPISAMAGPVNETNVTTFQAGEPARAADVNETIQALVTAVNDNAARVASLEAIQLAYAYSIQALEAKTKDAAVRIVELEAALRNAHRPLNDLLAGSTYKIYAQTIGNGFGEYFHSLGEYSWTEKALEMSSRFEVGQIVLHDGGAVSINTESHERETLLTNNNTEDDYDFDFTHHRDEAKTNTETGTWVLSGQILTLTLGTGMDQEVVSFTVSPDGQNLMLGEKSIEDVFRYATDIALLSGDFLIGVRTNPRNIFVETFEGTPYPHNGPIIDFGSPPVVPLGQPVFRSVRIINRGDSDLTNMTVNILHGDPIFEIVKGLDSPRLGPGQQALITIRCLTLGQIPRTLKIHSDDPDTPTYDVNLKTF